MSDDTEVSQSDERPEDDLPAERKEETQELTPEEQMALYEESLKESDWGHQPC